MKVFAILALLAVAVYDSKAEKPATITHRPVDHIKTSTHHPALREGDHIISTHRPAPLKDESSASTHRPASMKDELSTSTHYPTPLEGQYEVFLGIHKPECFVGQLQDTPDSLVESFGNFGPNTDDDASSTGFLGIPSCKLGLEIGLPICIAKCISREHIAGYCWGITCHCLG